MSEPTVCVPSWVKRGDQVMYAGRLWTVEHIGNVDGDMRVLLSNAGTQFVSRVIGRFTAD